MPKFTELPGASPPGPPPRLCPGPAGGLTAPPDPQLFFWSLWPRHYQNASDGPVSTEISGILSAVEGYHAARGRYYPL